MPRKCLFRKSRVEHRLKCYRTWRMAALAAATRQARHHPQGPDSAGQAARRVDHTAREVANQASCSACLHPPKWSPFSGKGWGVGGRVRGSALRVPVRTARSGSEQGGERLFREGDRCGEQGVDAGCRFASGEKAVFLAAPQIDRDGAVSQRLPFAPPVWGPWAALQPGGAPKPTGVAIGTEGVPAIPPQLEFRTGGGGAWQRHLRQLLIVRWFNVVVTGVSNRPV